MSGSNNDDDNNYEDDDDSDNKNNNHHPSPIKESLFAGNCKNLKKSARYLKLWQMN